MDASKISSRSSAIRAGRKHGLEAAWAQHQDILSGLLPELRESQLGQDWYTHAAEAATTLGVPDRWRNVYHVEYDRSARALVPAYYAQRQSADAE